MCDISITQKGILLLENFLPKNDGEKEMKDWLLAYQFETTFVDDEYAWLSCILALKASGQGNFGIGCVLVDEKGRVVIEGHNQVFYPYFRSDRHGEMVVINSFEHKHKGKQSLETYALYSSLESCPMCLTRLITSGIGKVSYVAPDMTGGMVHKIDDLPEVWHQLSENQLFDQAKCSKDLIDVAFQIFLLNAEELNTLIKKR
jgi:cytosine deaminase